LELETEAMPRKKENKAIKGHLGKDGLGSSGMTGGISTIKVST